MRSLIDTNIVLDLILERKPFVQNALLLFEHVENGSLEGYIAATTITNIFYIIRKSAGREGALAAVNRLVLMLRLCAVDRQTIETALETGLKDFEDGIQLACATIE